MRHYVERGEPSPIQADAEEAGQHGSLSTWASHAAVSSSRGQESSLESGARFLLYSLLRQSPHTFANDESYWGHLLKIQPPGSLPWERPIQWVWEGVWGF